MTRLLVVWRKTGHEASSGVREAKIWRGAWAPEFGGGRERDTREVNNGQPSGSNY